MYMTFFANLAYIAFANVEFARLFLFRDLYCGAPIISRVQIDLNQSENFRQ